MTVNETKQGDQIILAVDGRVDANTAPQMQKAILTAFQKGSHVVVDMEKVPYMSSAGLRALQIGMRTAKSKSGSMVVKNVNDSVMEVLELTGFSQFLTIEK